MEKRSRIIRFAVLLIALALCLAPLTPRYAQAACPDGMNAYWNMDDSSGTLLKDLYGHDATCTANCSSPAAGIVNGAQLFNSTQAIINGSDFNWGSTDSFSVEFWAKPGTTACTTGETNVILGRNGGNLNWWIGLVCNNGAENAAFYLADIAADGTPNGAFVNGTSNLQDGNWHHVVVVRDGSAGQNRIYVDGQLQGSVSATYSVGFSAEADIDLGWLNQDAGYFYDGSLDEFAVYSRALSNSEIADHYARGISHTGYCADISNTPANNPPAAAALVYPGNGDKALNTKVWITWKKTTDPENDALSYDLYISESSDFSQTAPIAIASAAKPVRYASATGLGLGALLFGTVLAGLNRRKRGALLLAAVILLASMFLISCSGGSSNSPSTPSGNQSSISGNPPAADEMGYQAELKPATTYYWKVVAKDAAGNSVPSEVRSFTTK